uniref:Uncharacterized protein n=1 Tax=Arundo donax TaxID=35708 RepID=A0A0A9AEG2_ARUDO
MLAHKNAGSNPNIVTNYTRSGFQNTWLPISTYKPTNTLAHEDELFPTLVRILKISIQDEWMTTIACYAMQVMIPSRTMEFWQMKPKPYYRRNRRTKIPIISC